MSEPQRPGEGEPSCALRLLARLHASSPRLVDIFSFDALYATSTVLNTLRAQGQHAVIVLKNNQPSLLRDAQGLFAFQPPSLSYTANAVRVHLWDAEGFTSLEGCHCPLRVVRCIETRTLRQRIAGQWTEKTEQTEWYWVTTLPQSEMSGPDIRRIGHARWQIENRGFNDLSTHWALDHCFKHHPQAIVAFLLTLAMAHLLMSSFFHFNLKECRRRTLTTLALARTLYHDLLLYLPSHPTRLLIVPPAPP